MGTWLKNLLRQIVIKIGIKPIISYLISLLRDKVEKTPTKYDDYGLDIIEAVNQKGEYELKVILMTTLLKLKELSLTTPNQYDDRLVNLLIRVVQSDVITLEKAFDELVVEIETYSKTTETPFDDFIPIALRQMKPEIFK